MHPLLRAILARDLLLVAAGIALIAGSSSGRASGSPPPAPAIVFVRGGDLYAVSLDRRVVRLTRTKVQEVTPAVSFDGRRIAFSRNFRGISVIGVRDRRPEIWTRTGSMPAWAPDGRTIYFVRDHPAAHGAECGVIHASASGTVRQVTRLSGSQLDPAVSPDGRRIAFTHWNACEGGTASPKLTVVDPFGRITRDLERLPENGYYPNPEHASPAWSPNGARLAFMKDNDLFLANRDGSSERRLTRRVDASDPPAWSRDGSWIAFTRSGSVYVIRPDGSGLRRLTRGADVGGWLSSLPR